MSTNVDSFFDRVHEIKDFSLVVALPPIMHWSDSKFAVKLAERLYDEVQSIVRTAEFFYETQIRATHAADKVVVEYADDKFDFSITCSRDGIHILRPGSRMAAFTEWYRRFMPQCKQLVDSIVAVLQDLLGRKISPVGVIYRFSVITFDFRQPLLPAHRLRNFEVLQPLCAALPRDDGSLGGTTESVQSVSRFDFNVHRWHGAVGARRNVVYRVEAPANKDYTSIWFTFAFKGETYTEPSTGVRYEVNVEDLLEEHESAFDWFRDCALGGFMKSLLGQHQFDTTASFIP